MFRGKFDYKIIKVGDGAYDDIKQYFNEGTQYIETSIQNGGAILVHCAAGRSRSGAMMTAYSMLRDKIKLEDALNLVKSKRPKVDPNWGFLKQLKEFEEELDTPTYDV
mmetsp:Transcript_16025/g.15745  ORF Transcript_16025/g.15745 Transcript_16025/m.15745 type:complete len:108 (-) Transcript_16025:18-341(-)